VLLATWNVNSLKVRMPRLLELIDKHAPDVICLQETRAEAAAFPELELTAAGYAATHHSAGRWAGVAILAREELGLEGVSTGLPGEAAPDQARWVEATVGGVRVVSVYVPNGQSVGSEPFAQKLRFLEAMAERVEQLRGGSLALCGDMNVCPTDLDVYDPKAFVGETHVTPEERALLAAVRERGELTDAFRALHPDEPGFTWWDYRQGHFHRGMGLRIDQAVLSSDLAALLRSCGIDRDLRKGPKPSDHAPLLVGLGS
jgi:exodeoxyribonuclease III